MYQGFYINLDRATHRRSELERHLAAAGLAERYRRYPAIDGATITYGPEAVPGTAALGCTLSHLSLVKQQLHSGEHLHVLEDDAVLHREVPRVFEAFLAQVQNHEWDILMTDFFLPPDLHLFKFLHEKYQECSRTGSLTFLDISDWDFAGANSYFLNDASKEKFLQMVESGFDIGVPYDIRIRALAKNKLLKVYACFPFFSTLADSSGSSTIAGDFQPVLPLSEYRRAFYVEPNLEAMRDNLRGAISVEPDLHTQIYLNMVELLVDPRFTRF